MLITYGIHLHVDIDKTPNNQKLQWQNAKHASNVIQDGKQISIKFTTVAKWNQ